MRYSHAASLAAALVPLSDALHLVQRDVPAVLHLDTQRRADIDLVAHDRVRRGLGKRQDSKTLQETLDNLQTLYFANASLGTPEQAFRLHIDTGSSDLWVNAANSSFCEDASNGCSEAGTYNAGDSSSYEFVNDEFNISYVDGSGAAGDYGRETFHFGGSTIEGLQFGIGYSSSSAEGILGIGYAINEVQVQRAGGQPYANLPQLLVDNGMINNNAYSLWLNDLDASTGSILFGGVDTRKYSGELQTLPILAENDGEYAEFIIALTGMGQNGNNGSLFQDRTVAVLLDSGSTLMYLPDDIVQDLYQSMNAQYDSQEGTASVDCSAANSDDTLEFTFSGPTISVPMNELVIVSSVNRRGEESCILGIAPAGSSTAVLGDTFLRSAYVVYDLNKNTISLAQTAFNSTESNILEISNSTGIPNATGVPGAVATADVNGGGARNGGAGGAPGATGTTGSEGAGPRATAMPWIGAAAAGLGLLAVL